MRPTPWLLASALLVATATRAAPILVNPALQRVETSRLVVQFAGENPDRVAQLIFKDYDPFANLAAEDYVTFEFFGQTLRQANQEGFIQALYQSARSWTLVQQSADRVDVRIETETEGEPPVTTRYTFFADAPYFVVDRTIHFSLAPDSAAYQSYVPRLKFLTNYRACRWRDHAGTLVQRVYCAAACTEADWDGRWLQSLFRSGETRKLGLTALFATLHPVPGSFVRGWGPSSNSDWLAPLVPAGLHAQDETARILVSLSTDPDDLGALDSLYTMLNTSLSTLDARPPVAVAALRLTAAPNPSRGEVRLAWEQPRPGRVSLTIHDVAGRRIARVFDGEAGAGLHAAAWDGRRQDDTPCGAGLFFARLACDGRTAVTHIVREP